MSMRPSALLTDFYQLSMAQSYWQAGIHDRNAVFHVFFRRNPIRDRYVVAAGLQRVIDFLNDFHFTSEDIDYLASLSQTKFSKDFLVYLKKLRFTGDIDAAPEGSVVFANEPLLRIRAPLALCQLLETPLVNALNFSSAVATMASRFRMLAPDDLLFEFGLRRAQGPDGGLTASRSAYLGGFDATSNTLAGKLFHIPVIGTMAHSFIMAFDDEKTAFETYAALNPDNVILLVDTYDTLKGVDRAIAIPNLKAIRLDSGDLNALSKAAREKLDRAGLSHVKIFASGDIHETMLAELKKQRAPIDGWGVGTHLSTSYEQPALDMVYKLGAIEKNGQFSYRLKRSDNNRKTSDPGILQVKRLTENKRWLRDVIYDIQSPVISNATAEDLLKPIFQSGRLVYSSVKLSQSREYCLQQVQQYHASPDFVVERDAVLIDLKNSLLKKYDE
ncbi:MAG: nicotinate phosphoribosyltransferase [Gammaproteobacteria bacterium RIFCSPLOWO2_02_FULL_42_14]|nr:MAG: nicotinate phosphoribosyltransferase [Gammaproteobacteria bacterium RIFCSPHIGHO2_02_FULL_42_43]OGT53026.1 MAG: nicotinate phosphoribosyltransferase [Gammaproteobacteria bacterium RIFCSPHIGHO2_12_FULL_41_25]OGT61201.1 MAG: nicotinate phosphoribosyltransferase [Gammaproteobacteria bacterium RIFCSPLOWO2_02_FULL_42_14]OGT87128.1 MAG: nicotinate phosphoribosyltransferase [Gammaproteobacteria bacterium RIFCSPLOWO2_12_FULL_42_18]